MKELRFGLIGAGFWASYHMAGWREVAGTLRRGLQPHASQSRTRGSTIRDRAGV